MPPYCVAENEGKGRKPAPLFSHTIILSCAFLAVTITIALNALNGLDRELKHSSVSFTENVGNQMSNEPFSGWKRDQVNHLGDVITPPIRRPFDVGLRQLTGDNALHISSPFEIPLSHMLDMLAASYSANISVSPDLRFFATPDDSLIQVCPSAAPLFETGINKQPECFLIEIQPSKLTPATGPRIL